MSEIKPVVTEKTFFEIGGQSDILAFFANFVVSDFWSDKRKS